MCGGITVFTPFRVFDVRPGMKVGVIGIGGLGHLGLQFASALGFEVTAFSNSSDKEEQTRRFGAHHFINGCDPAQLEAVANRFDFLLCTATGKLPWAGYLAALKPRGKLCIVGVPPNDIAVPVLPLILGQKTICGIPIGSPADIQEIVPTRNSKWRIEVTCITIKFHDKDFLYGGVLLNGHYRY